MHDDTLLTALTRRFDADQERLRGVALRMTGSRAEAEDVLAAARAELGRDGTDVAGAWLAAHVGQACVRGLQERAAAGRPGPGGGGLGEAGGWAGIWAGAGPPRAGPGRASGWTPCGSRCS